MERVAFFVAQSIAILAAWGIARAAFRGREPWRVALASALAFLLLTTGSVALAGALGRLRLASVLLPQLAVGLVAWGAVRRRERAPAAVAPPPTIPSPNAVVAAAVMAALLGIVGCRGGFCANTLTWDDFAYHAALPAHWLREGSIDLAPFGYQAYYPANAELAALWFLLPLHADAYASLAGALFLGIALLALFGIVRALGAGAVVAALLVLAFFLSTATSRAAATFTGIDLAGPAAGLAALALLAPGEERPAATRADTVLSGLAAGFAVGCRPTFWIVVAAGAALLLSTTPNGATRRERRLHALVFGAAALAIGLPWYLRNFVITGNPLYPVELGPFHGPLRGEALARTELLSWITGRFDAGSEFSWRSQFAEWGDWPPSLALLAGLGFVVSALLLPDALRAKASQPRARFAVLLLAAALVFLLQYPLTPFSGTVNRPLVSPWHVETQRMVIFVFVAGVALFALGFAARATRVAALIAAVALIALAAPAAVRDVRGWPGAIGGLAVAAAAWIVRRRRLAARAIAIAAAAAFLGLLAWRTPQKQAEQDAAVRQFVHDDDAIGPAWLALEALPAGSRVAAVHSDPVEYALPYALFGRRFQLEPVNLRRDGTPAVPLHEAEPASWWQPWEELRHPIDAQAFRAALLSQRIDAVVISRFGVGDWPPQREALREIAGVHMLFEDNCSVVLGLPKRAHDLSNAPSR